MVHIAEAFTQAEHHCGGQRLRGTVRTLDVGKSRHKHAQHFRFDLTVQEQARAVPLRLLQLLFLRLLAFRAEVGVPRSMFAEQCTTFQTHVETVAYLFTAGDFHRSSLVEDLPEVDFPDRPLRRVVESEIRGSLELPSRLDVCRINVHHRVLQELGLGSAVGCVLDQTLAVGFVGYDSVDA